MAASKHLTPEERRLRAQVAAYTSWANTPNRSTRTEPARAGWYSKFIRQVDPAGVLDPAERARRADAAMKAEMMRMALKSSQARRKSRA